MTEKRFSTPAEKTFRTTLLTRVIIELKVCQVSTHVRTSVNNLRNGQVLNILRYKINDTARGVRGEFMRNIKHLPSRNKIKTHVVRSHVFEETSNILRTD